MVTFYLYIVLIIMGVLIFIYSLRENSETGAALSAMLVVFALSGIYFGEYKKKVKPSEEKVIEYKYPSKDYKFDYEIVQREEQIDTFYVLTKIK